MQTFLPYADVYKSASVLDYRRLGKQRVECKQILTALNGGSKGWVNHPATKMWRGYEQALIFYSMAMCLEWKARGYNDSLLPFFMPQLHTMSTTFPDWWGREDVHQSHRSNLLRKDTLFYSQYGWREPTTLEYVWPVL